MYILPEIVHLLTLENVEYVSASLYSFNVAVYTCFYSSVMLVSLLNLLLLAIDYYIAIVKPLHYSSIVTKSRTRACIVFIWIVSFITVTVVTESIPEIINYCENSETKTSFCIHMKNAYTINLRSNTILSSYPGAYCFGYYIHTNYPIAETNCILEFNLLNYKKCLAVKTDKKS